MLIKRTHKIAYLSREDSGLQGQGQSLQMWMARPSRLPHKFPKWTPRWTMPRKRRCLWWNGLWLLWGSQGGVWLIGLFRLSPEYTSCFVLLNKDSPKSSHGHFRLVHLICICSFNSGYLLLLFRPIYLFIYLRCIRKNIIIRKHAHVCLYFHAVVSTPAMRFR